MSDDNICGKINKVRSEFLVRYRPLHTSVPESLPAIIRSNTGP